ncbi:MAG: TAXI family TRAP transporter solute-binding subunit [Pseudomonadota bacterium]
MRWPVAVAGLCLALTSVVAHAERADGGYQWPRALAFSAYNLGSTGYNQAVAIGKMLKDEHGVTLRVVPGKNDVSRLLPLVKRRVQFSANGMATYFAQEGMFQFATKSWGPLPARLVLSSNGDSNQSLAVAADTGIRSFAELRGKRVPWVRGAPALNVSTEAFLACGGLTWDDVERVDFPGYNAMWNGIVNGQIDAAYATTVSGTTRKLEASPRGIFWPPAPHDDAQCWSAMTAIAPYFVQHIGTRGAGISTAQPHEGATYPYPMLMTLPSQPVALVEALVESLHEHYDQYKDADPGAIGWALDRQDLTWVVPYHEGTIAYLTRIGRWGPAEQTHNDRLLARQQVLADAWARLVKAAPPAAQWESQWRSMRAAALEDAGFEPVWR